ncbi:MAG: DUF4384 domain-containing protein [Chitinispirillaceae bacterium]|nr:DUF4384 domain-containing protein [Chitinispirillaceae bacterium]
MACEKYDKLTLFSFVTGDLSGEKRLEMESHLRRCVSCAGFVKQAVAERAEFLEAFPVIDVVPVKSLRFLRFTPMRTALALAAGLVLAVGAGSLLVNRSGEAYRTKGGVALNLFAQDTAGSPVVRREPVFTPGERIQFTYSCGNERYFILASIDDTGRISVFYPAEGDNSMLLEPGRDLPLPNSIVLDEYIGKELYIAVFSARPLQVAAVVDKIQRALTVQPDLCKTVLKIENAAIRSILLTKREHQR